MEQKKAQPRPGQFKRGHDPRRNTNVRGPLSAFSVLTRKLAEMLTETDPTTGNVRAAEVAELIYHFARKKKSWACAYICKAAAGSLAPYLTQEFGREKRRQLLNQNKPTQETEDHDDRSTDR